MARKMVFITPAQRRLAAVKAHHEKIVERLKVIFESWPKKELVPLRKLWQQHILDFGGSADVYLILAVDDLLGDLTDD